MAWRRSGKLEPEPVLRGWERDFTEGWLFRQLSTAESTRSLLSERSPPELRVTRTLVRITRTSPGKWGLRTLRPERGIGEPGAEPHGREWMKHSTGPEEAETVKVVRNGAGGPERDWNPATRYGDHRSASRGGTTGTDRR
jgi:hypothetical protein